MAQLTPSETKAIGQAVEALVALATSDAAHFALPNGVGAAAFAEALRGDMMTFATQLCRQCKSRSLNIAEQPQNDFALLAGAALQVLQPALYDAALVNNVTTKKGTAKGTAARQPASGKGVLQLPGIAQVKLAEIAKFVNRMRTSRMDIVLKADANALAAGGGNTTAATAGAGSPGVADTVAARAGASSAMADALDAAARLHGNVDRSSERVTRSRSLREHSATEARASSMASLGMSPPQSAVDMPAPPAALGGLFSAPVLLPPQLAPDDADDGPGGSSSSAAAQDAAARMAAVSSLSYFFGTARRDATAAADAAVDDDDAVYPGEGSHFAVPYCTADAVAKKHRAEGGGTVEDSTAAESKPAVPPVACCVCSMVVPSVSAGEKVILPKPTSHRALTKRKRTLDFLAQRDATRAHSLYVCKGCSRAYHRLCMVPQRFEIAQPFVCTVCLLREVIQNPAAPCTLLLPDEGDF